MSTLTVAQTDAPPRAHDPDVIRNMPDRSASRRIALFTSADSFEGFYAGTFGLTREAYLSDYRNDFVWDYAKGLVERGHEIVIYILSYGPALIREICPGIAVRFVHIDRWMRLVDPVLWRFSRLAPSSRLRAVFAARAYGQELRRRLTEDRIQVLYHQEIWTPRFDIIVEQVGIPVIGAEHGAVFDKSMISAKRRSLPRAVKLVCQTSSNLRLAKDLGGDAVLLTNAVDCDFFAPKSGQRTRSILAVGRLVDSQKRFSDLLRALARLPSFTLTLVGAGPDEGFLRRLAGELDISDRIVFAGFVSDRARLRTLYQECGVFACPSSWEAVALVVLEAMSCAAPVVVSRIPSFEELIENDVNGVLIETGAVDALVHAIGHAWLHGERLGRAAREVAVDRYSSKKMFESLGALISLIPSGAPETACPTARQTRAASRPTRRASAAADTATVLIASYKRPDALLRCLRALAGQTRLPDTVMVVVRSDDDATLDALQGLPTPFVLDVQRVSAPGTVAARNLGLDANRDDIIAIIDDDTEPFPDWLERAVGHFVGDRMLGGLGGRDRCFDGRAFDDRELDVVGKVQWFGRLIGNHHLGHGSPREIDFLKGANMIFRAEAIGNLRFDWRLRGAGAQPAEDVAFSIRVKSEGWKLLYDPAVLVNHYPGSRAEQRLYVGVHRSFDSGSFGDYAFNEAIAVWPALTIYRRFAFVMWSVFVGTGTCPGFVQALRYSKSLGRTSWLRFAVAQRGKMRAFATLLAKQ